MASLSSKAVDTYYSRAPDHTSNLGAMSVYLNTLNDSMEQALGLRHVSLAV